MNRITLEAFHDDPGLSRRLNLAAQRERALAVHNGLVWLRERLTRRLHRAPARWLARLG